LGVGFVDNKATRDRIYAALERCIYRSYIFYIDRQAVAFLDGLAYKGTFFGGTTGYDPKYEHYHIGTFLLMSIIEDLCKDRSVKAMDFGLGDAEYKRIYCNECWQEGDIYLFAPNLRDIGINLLRTSLRIAEMSCRKVAKTIGMEGKIKQLWRGIVARGNRVEGNPKE